MARHNPEAGETMKRSRRNVLLRLLDAYPSGVRTDRIPDGNGRCHKDTTRSLCLTIGLMAEDGLIAQATDDEGWVGYALTEAGLAAARHLAIS